MSSINFLFILIAIQWNLLFIECRHVLEIQKLKSVSENIFGHSTNVHVSRQEIEKDSLKSNLKSDRRNSVNRSRRQVDKDGNEADLETCDEFYTCEHNENKVLPNCYCDRNCSYFNDCCNNFDRNIRMGEEMLSRTNMSCRVNIRGDMYSYGRGYWMVKTCPDSFNISAISSRCMTNEVDNVPVTTKSGIVYDNPFCAICNDDIEFVPWQVRVEINNPLCQKDFPQTLISNENTQLVREFSDLRNSLCEFYYNPPLDSNPRVCQLSDVRSRQDICDADSATEFSGGWKEIRILSLNVLFSLSPPKTGGDNECDDNKEYDPKSGLCFIKTCGSGSETCNKSEVVSVENYKFSTNVIFVSNFPLQLSQGREALFLFMACIPFEHFGFQIQMDKVKFLSSFHPIFEMEDTKIHTLINITMDIVVTKIYKVSDIINLRAAMEEFGWTYLIRSQNIEIQRIWNASYYPMSNTLYYGSYLKEDFDYDEEVMKRHLNTINIQHNGFERNKFPHFCNVSLASTRNSNGKTIRLSCYNKLENIIKPSDNKHSHLHNLKTTNFQAILTYVTLSLSSVAIIPTLGIQRYLQLTQTTPGHISENILVVIFIFDIIFMVGTGATDYGMFCLFSSVMAHYLILCCFIWISIFVFHTISTLRGLKKVKRGNRQTKQSFSNSLYAIGYISPLVIILPSVIADICECSPVQIGYTKDICFPTAYPANLVVFVGPVILFVLINLGGLIFAAWTLCRLNVYLSHKGITNSRSFVGVYIRLSVLSGLSWGFGVLSEWLDNDILRFIFIIFTGTHGLMFCICIISTKLVRDTIREKCFPKNGNLELEMDKVCGTIEDNGNNALENASASDET